MPTRAPTYYHWSMDKPCTTNQVYGFDIKDSMVEVQPTKTPGPFDYVRPFSNTAFFPQISASSSHNLTTSKSSQTKSATAARAGPSSSVSMGQNRFNINRGYTVGYIPITDRLVRSSVPADRQLDRSKSAPSNSYQYRKPKADTLYLWHTLAGSLVHVKNYPADGAAY